MRKLLALSMIFSLLLLAGCGAETVNTTTPESSAPPAPAQTPEETLSEQPVQQQAYTESTEVVDIMHILTQAKTTQFTTGEAVEREDLETILLAGLNAPSAVNYQPWHFTVITDAQLLADLGQEVLEVYEYGTYAERFNLWNAHTAILISADESPYNADFDCGLAAEAMSITAQYLGYGTKFLAHPNAVLNGPDKEHYKEVFDIPTTYTAVAILLIGVPENSADAVSSASTRVDFSEKVSFVD